MPPSRISRLQEKVHERGLDALLVSSLPHIRYLTGFSGSNALCIVGAARRFFLTDVRYTLQSRQEVKGWRRVVSPLGLYESAAEQRLLARARNVGFEEEHVTQAQYRTLRRLFPGVRFRTTSGLVEEMTLVKDPSEIGRIKRAVDLTDAVFAEILSDIRPGVREREIAAEISYRQKVHGAEGDAFDSIVVAGKRGALPHGKPTGKRIRPGEFVTLDFGCIVDGYHSDLTRTVAVGRASPRMKQMYNAVLEAQRAAIDAARAGMLARDLDSVARNSLHAAGFGKYFTHSLGHGLGLVIHERPRVSRLSTERLVAGTVITIEPGIYLPGVAGIRIEDDVVITENGCRVLTKAPKDLMIV
jgi:Xaa-Pro aminopeptidase